MKLSTKQQLFCKAMVNLISYGNSLGYEFTFGDAYSADTCTHRNRLALDLNLFVDDEYITDGGHPAWAVLHDYGEKLGLSKMIKNDANHFSMTYMGVR